MKKPSVAEVPRIFRWLGALACLGAAAVPAQEVTLPLARYDELRALAREAPAEEPEPPAPWAFEEAVLTVEIGEHSARVTHDLTLAVYADGWHTVPLPQLGTFIDADFGALEGRLRTDGGWALEMRGEGRRQVRLTTVVPVSEDRDARRLTRTLRLRAPSAALVRGTLELGDGVEEVASDGPLILAGGDGRERAFTLGAGQSGELTLLGPSAAPARAELPPRFEATSATVLEVSPHRRRARIWLDVRMLQGELDELSLPVPEGYEVLAVGGEVAGWDVAADMLTVHPLVPVAERLELEIEIAAGPAGELVSPVVHPPAAVVGVAASKVEAESDGLLELLDAGAARRLTERREPALPAAFHDAGGMAFELAPDAPPPRWRVSWADGTEVLAAQVDRLLLDCLVGESGRAFYQLWAEVRSRGSRQLELDLPPGAELVTLRRDGVPLEPGRGRGTWVVPLRAAGEAQVIYLSAVHSLDLPDDGDFELPLPRLSVPVGRVEVRTLLPGGRSYRLAEEARAGRAGQPPGITASHAPSPLANQLGVATATSPEAGPAAGFAAANDLYPAPDGFTVVEAAWSALTPSPAPLRLAIAGDAARKEWF